MFGVEVLRVAFASLKANLLRSLLTMLGIVIGVASVITMIALGTGAENAIKEKIARLGTTILQIDPQRVTQNGVATTQAAKLTMKDVEAIRDGSPHVVGVNQTQDRSLQVVWTNRNTNVQVTGTAANFLEVRGFRMDVGRMFTEREERGQQRVAVLGAQVLPLLGVTPTQILDERIRIAGRYFTVVGVLAERGVSGVGDGGTAPVAPIAPRAGQRFPGAESGRLSLGPWRDDANDDDAPRRRRRGESARGRHRDHEHHARVGY